MEREDNIDLGKLFAIIMDRKKLFRGIVVGCTLIAIIVSLLLPKTYTSSVIVQIGDSKFALSDGAAALVAMIGSSNGKAGEYIEIMKTRTVLAPIIQDVYSDKEWDKRQKVEDFAKSNLDIRNTKGTNLIVVNAKGRSPEEAHTIAQGVINNFLKLMTDVNYQSQSKMVKFLSERIEVAQKEADDAAQKLNEYSKENKLYEPDDLGYLKLERDAKIKQEIYSELVKQVEKAKIQQVMESMDIQVLAPASMPEEDKPTGPRKKLIAVIGLLIGCMISLGYSLLIYRREN